MIILIETFRNKDAKTEDKLIPVKCDGLTVTEIFSIPLLKDHL